jgi:hypothetical protein
MITVKTLLIICFLGYLAHVGAAVELKRKEKGGEKEL